MSTIVGPIPGQRIGGVRGIPPADNGKYLKSTVSAPVWEDIQASEIAGLASATAISTRIYRSTAQSFPVSVYTAAVFNTARYDNGGMWSATNPTRLTAQRDGTYVIWGEICWDAISGGIHRLAAIRLNGGTMLAEGGITGATIVGGAVIRAPVETVVKMSPGDYVELLCFQDSASAVTNSGAGQQNSLEFSMALIAGAKGDKGDQGPPGTGGGGGGGVAFEFTQSSPAAVWPITHNLGVHPSVTVVDTGSTVVIPDVHYDSMNAVTLTFGSATTGKAFLN